MTWLMMPENVRNTFYNSRWISKKQRTLWIGNILILCCEGWSFLFCGESGWHNVFRHQRCPFWWMVALQRSLSWKGAFVRVNLFPRFSFLLQPKVYMLWWNQVWIRACLKLMRWGRMMMLQFLICSSQMTLY